jgi:hypothetical protein
MGKWRYSSAILDLGTRWRWLVSFMLRPLYIRGNSPSYSLDRRLGGAPEPVWAMWRMEKLFAAAENRTPVVQHFWEENIKM